MVYECVVLKPALRFLEEQVDDREREQIIGIIEDISCDPFIDVETKFYFPAPPVFLNICEEAGWWIIYYIHGKSEIRIVNIGRAAERRDIRRPD